MIQRRQPHPIGTFLRCSGCAREPAHIISRGRPYGQPCDPRNPVTGDRHHIECARCGRATARTETLAPAITEWGANYAQQQLPFRVGASRRRAA